jgi:endonuclease G
MAPNHAIVSRYGEEAQLETFLMSNIVPQRKELNRYVWKDIEELEAVNWSKRLHEVWVITGPVYDDKPEYLRGRQSGIEIPDAFFKVVIDETGSDSGAAANGSKKGRGASEKGNRHDRGPRVLAFLIPQDVTGTEKPGEFLVSVDWIEDRTGLDLMPDLPDDVEERLESEVADRLW